MLGFKKKKQDAESFFPRYVFLLEDGRTVGGLEIKRHRTF